MECRKFNQNEIVEGNLTILEMMAELDKLRLENQQLTKERDDFKEGFMILHNIIEEQKQNDNKEFLNNDEGGYTEDEYLALAKGYADFGY